MLKQFALAGFALATIAYLGLAFLGATRRAPGPGRLLFASVAAEMLWAALNAAVLADVFVPEPALAFAEALRLFFWIAFLLSLIAAMGGRSADAGSATQRAVGGGMVAVACIAAGLVAIEVFSIGDRARFVAHVIGAVFALVCLEQVYRNTPAEGRWALKFLAVALLAMFGFDLALYSEALLFSRLNPALWTARGYANALLVPLLAVAAARNRRWNLPINISRDVVFHSTTLFATGLFLIVMAVAGYWVRYFGGQWGETLQILLAFTALISALIALLSSNLRARLRVFLSKHFFRYRYDYRTEWLKLTQLLAMAPAVGASGGSGAAAGAASEQAQTPLEIRSLQGLAALVESHGGALWLAGEHGEHVCEARWGFKGDTPALNAGEPLLRFLQQTQWVISLPEWRATPQHYQHLSLPAALTEHPDNWLIVPLMLHDDLLGFAVLTRPVAPAVVNWEVRDALKAAARQVASYLGVRRAVESLVQARQFESFNRMSAFVVHDLKNLVAQLSLLMANAARHRHNPDFQQDMLDTVENVLGRMQGLLMQLRAGTRPIDVPGAVPVVGAIEAALKARRGRLPEPELVIAAELRHVAVLAHRDRLERVIGHLVQNATEATPNDGRIWIRLRREDDQACIEIEDTGKGMSERFIRESLFRPFESTKEHGMGIGAFESREYVRELGGTLDVESREGQGTLFRIRLPLALATA